jgi:hypothetical protein
MMVLLACATACDDAKGAPRAATSQRIEVKNECLINNNTLLFHVLFDIDYAASSNSPAYKSRYIYQFKCNRTNRACSGVTMRLKNVDSGKPIDLADLDEVTGAVLTTTGSTFVVKWGPLRTFSLDLSGEQGSVRYVESGEGLVSGHVEGRAESKCELRDATTCSDDTDCLPKSKCSRARCAHRK